MGWIFAVKSDNLQRREKKNGKRHHTSQALDMQQPYTSAQKAPFTVNTQQPARLETLCRAPCTSSWSPETCSLLQLHMHVVSSVLYGNSSSNPSLTEQWHHLQKHSWDKRHSLPFSYSTETLCSGTRLPSLCGLGRTSLTLSGALQLVTRQSSCQKTASTSAARSE